MTAQHPQDENGGDDGATKTTGGPIHVSYSSLLIAVAPLLCLALSHQMELQLENAMLISIGRSALQLHLLGAVLKPIFHRGRQHWWIVMAYVMFMITMAAVESSARPKYYFDGMLFCVLTALGVTVLATSLIVFGLILRPQPLWHPQYVITICGMLLGNCINSVTLSLNSLLTNFVERSQEIAVYQSFGATPAEACRRLVQDAVRNGSLPWINSMAVIGLVSIPGMMTGQILGGTPPLQAAAYQLLISYAIAFATFGAILVEMQLVLQVLFDGTTHIVQTEALVHKRPRRQTLIDYLQTARGWLERKWRAGRLEHETADETLQSLRQGLLQQRAENATLGEGPVRVTTARSSNSVVEDNPTPSPRSLLKLYNVSRTFTTTSSTDADTTDSSSSETTMHHRTLFANVSAHVAAGELVLISGNSGTGKSQLLQLVAGLAAADADSHIQLRLNGNDNNNGDNDGTLLQLSDNPELWKQRIRYVSQSKLDIPGTPHDLIDKVASFSAWRNNNKNNNMPTAHELTSTAHQLAWDWGLDTRTFENEWKLLSGGEAQRAYLAIAMASQPSLLLLDESTSALDPTSKQQVEESVAQYLSNNDDEEEGGRRRRQQQQPTVLWVTHDQEQIQRLQRRYKAALWTFESSSRAQVCHQQQSTIEPVAEYVGLVWLLRKLGW
eukprot:CAMPEP_0168760532 /NCGR_PEP_ID=MMETSP0724-20121128/22825_1 /TAXON_ID=265536 /ORGANISM="Amphiprora sp., Strain CCMP467" /LENGTH=668 /DNA_ID=CAMNT_0008809565 /DNA_START=44 /DNA_END=2047 /DNA_ORIENTATION=+